TLHPSDTLVNSLPAMEPPSEQARPICLSQYITKLLTGDPAHAAESECWSAGKPAVLAGLRLRNVNPPDTDIGAQADRPTPALAVRTLIRGGFVLDGAHRNPGYTILRLHRTDEFGAEHRYAFAVAEDSLN